jgi:hypothetical protein
MPLKRYETNHETSQYEYRRKTMRKGLFSLFIILIMVSFTTLVSGAPPESVPMKKSIADFKHMPYFVLAIPDLVVSIEGPATAVAGEDVALDITVRNKGGADAPGSVDFDYWKAYYVDIILSTDVDFPLGFAVQPSYAGWTIDDFIEDMLMAGGRISRTETIPPGGSHTYSYSYYIPAKIDPGIYWIGAVVDPGNKVAEINEGNNTFGHLIEIIPPRPPEVTPPAGVGFWIMPYAVGNTVINTIKSTGLVDYRDGSGIMMIDAPFGGTLGFRHGYTNTIPNPHVYYYRWQYRLDGTTTWNEFTEPVGVHYVREEGMNVKFPIYWLGPKPINGMNLYEFRPHNPPADPPASTYWPTSEWFGDIYSGILKSQTLPEGKYWIKLEIFSKFGVQVMPGLTSNTFIVPDGVDPDGTILTRLCNHSTEIEGGGFKFAIHIDNRPCSGYIDGPAIGGNVASDECGFLLYSPTDTDVHIAYSAWHPAGFAMHRFEIYRGIQKPVDVLGEVAATSLPPFTGDGSGNFYNDFTIPALLSSKCPDKAAFSENLYVYAKATRGWGHRLAHLDHRMVRAFALAPE